MVEVKHILSPVLGKRKLCNLCIPRTLFTLLQPSRIARATTTRNTTPKTASGCTDRERERERETVSRKKQQAAKQRPNMSDEPKKRKYCRKQQTKLPKVEQKTHTGELRISRRSWEGLLDWTSLYLLLSINWKVFFFGKNEQT